MENIRQKVDFKYIKIKKLVLYLLIEIIKQQEKTVNGRRYYKKLRGYTGT